MLQLKLEELLQVEKEQLERLVDDVGGISHLSKMLNVHYTTVQGWVERGRISKKGAKMVEDHMSLGEHYKAIELRPDL